MSCKGQSVLLDLLIIHLVGVCTDVTQNEVTFIKNNLNCLKKNLNSKAMGDLPIYFALTTLV